MTRPTKLELTWIGKENRPRLEPRILIEDPAKFYHAKFKRSDQQSAVSEGEGSQQQRPETKAQRRASVQQPSLFDLPGGKGGAK